MARQLSKRAQKLVSESRRFRCPRDPETVRKCLRLLDYEPMDSVLEFQQELGGLCYPLQGDQVTWGLWGFRKGVLLQRRLEPWVEVVDGRRYLFCGDYLGPIEFYLGEEGVVYGGLGVEMEALADNPWHILESDALGITVSMAGWECERLELQDDEASVETYMASCPQLQRLDYASGRLHTWWEGQGVLVRTHQSCSFSKSHVLACRNQDADARLWTQLLLGLQGLVR